MSELQLQSNKSVWAVIAGGGTAGHVHPGLAVARALVKRGYGPEMIHFVGSARGAERELVPAAGFELTLLPGRGIQRQISLQNAKSVWGLAQAIRQAVSLLRRLNPSVVLGVGGYASVACVLAARHLNIPLVIAEQNAVAGLANRLAGRWAQAAAVAFPDTDLPSAVFTGNPVRPEIKTVNPQAQRSNARTALGVDPQRVLIAVVSGSLGAAQINKIVFAAARALAERADISIYHVVGKRDWNDLAALRPAMGNAVLEYQAVAYCDQMADVYAAADLIVGRAGASSLAELCAVGVASLLVPLPKAPRDHQTLNAKHLASQGAAVHIADTDFSLERLLAEIDALLVDPQKLRAMADSARSLGHTDADDRVADLLEHHGCANNISLPNADDSHKDV